MLRVSTLLAAAGAVFVLSGGSVLAAEACECCEDMVPVAGMPCCDKMESGPVPVPAPRGPLDAPVPDGTGDRS